MGVELTYKERLLVEGVVSGKTQAQSAIDAGYSQRSAAVLASKTLKKVNVREAIIISMTANNLNLDDIVKPLADGLKAVKIDRYGNRLPDYNTRLKYVDIILKIMGVYS